MMQVQPEVLILVAVVLPIGLVVGFLLSRFRYGAEIRMLKDMLRQKTDNCEKLQQDLHELAGAHAAAREKITLLENVQARMQDTFRSISAVTLQENNRSFLDLARATLGEYIAEARSDLDARSKTVAGIIQPVKDALERYDRQVVSMEREREKAYGGLYQQIESLAGLQMKLQKETGRLATALRVPHVRGRWGEITLRRVVELAGLQDRCDFVEQPHLQGEQTNLRPDMVVHLPGRRMLAIDAKVPLSAYLDALETEIESEQATHLEKHARQVRAHLQSLSKKAYWQALETSPEFVILFIPGENFFSAALNKAPELIEEGVRRNVLPATPTTLVGLLKTVAYVWNQETAAENAKQIRDLGQELFERLQMMTGHLEDLGGDLQRCIRTYNQTIGSFNSRVMVSARKFPGLGIPVKNGGKELALQPVEDALKKVQRS